MNATRKITQSFIADGILIDGDVTSEGSLLVEGEVSGNISAPSTVIGSSGRIMGDIRGEDVIIEGHLTGNITGVHVSIVAGGVVNGEIAYASLAIEYGALFEGTARKAANRTR